MRESDRLSILMIRRRKPLHLNFDLKYLKPLQGQANDRPIDPQLGGEQIDG